VLDETVIRVNGQQYWLYAAVDPETNKFLHVRLFTTTTTALTQKFLRELKQKHDVSEAVFLVDHAHHLSAALNRVGIRYQTARHGNRNAVERLFREIKRRTSHLALVSAILLQQLLKHGYNRSPSGGIGLTEHDENTGR